MTQADLIFAIESAMDANGLESVLRILADTVSEKADILRGNMGYGIDPWGLDPEKGGDFDKAAHMIRETAEAIPDSTRG